MQTQQREQSTPEVTQHGVRRVLKNRSFVLLWIAQLISLTIFNAANFALIVLVNNTTHSVFMAGLAIISFTLPAIPFSAVAGVFVDKLDKRQVLWVSNILRTATMLLIFVCLVLDSTNLWPLFGLVYLTSLIGQFFVPAEGASIPLLVGERDLMPALALFNISITVSQALGFLILGRVVATLFPPFSLHIFTLTLYVESIDMVFVVSALLYAVCAGLILAIPDRAFEQAHLKGAYQRSRSFDFQTTMRNLWQDLIEGWRIVRSDYLLFYAVLQLSLIGIVMLLIGETAGEYVQNFMHRPAEDMAIVLAPAGVGLVGASLLMSGITARVGKVRLSVIGLLALATGFLCLPINRWAIVLLDPQGAAQSSWLLWSTVVLVLLLGVAMACVNIPTNTIMQEQAPDAGRARVLSLQYLLYNAGSIPVLLFAGVIAQVLGFTQLIVVVSAGLLLFCLWSISYLRRHQRKEAM